MPRNLLFECSPLRAGVPTTVRMSVVSATPAGTHLDGHEWTPVITQRHTKQITIANNGVLAAPDTGNGNIAFWMAEDFENEVWSSYEWSDAPARIFEGEDGDPFTAYRQVFEGNVSSLARDGITATLELLGPEAALDTPLLTLSYAGTGGVEGPTTLRGKLKPRAFGNCLTVDPVQVDPAKLVYQVHGYGAVGSIPQVYEFAQSYGPSKGNVASYGDLIAMTLAPGEWATCNAQGLFRLGGRADKKLSADVIMPNGTIATIIPQLLAVAGVPAAKIGSMAVFASSSWSLYQTEQTTVLEAVRSAALQGGGYILPDGMGVWQVGDYFATKAPIVLNEDRSSYPQVRRIKELPASPPVWKVSVGYDKCWNVHSESDVSPALKQLSEAQIANDAAAKAALEAAQLAAADATVAKARVDAMSADGILDRSEKASVIREFAEEAAQQTGLMSQSTNVDVSYERAVLAASFGALKTYLEALTPAYTNTNADTSIDRAAFDARWRDYWLAKQNLLNALAGKASNTATWGGVTGTGRPADNATVGAPIGTDVGGRPVVQLLSDTDQAKADAAKAAQDAVNAKSAADQASADTVAAKLRLSAIEADGVLDRSEKADVILRFSTAAAERVGLLNKGAEFNLFAERTAYSDAYDALVLHLNGLTPPYTDSTQDTPIDRAAFNAVWTSYFTQRQNLLNAIYTKARTAAETAQANADKGIADAAAAKAAADAAKAAADAAKGVADATTANFTAAKLTQILQKPIDDIAKLTLDYGAQSLTTSKDLFDRNEQSVRNLQTLILNEDGSIRVEKITDLGFRIAQGVAGEAAIRDAAIKDVTRLYQAGDAIIAADISTVGAKITTEVGKERTAREAALQTVRQAVIDGDYAQALRSDALSSSITGLVQPGGNIYNLEAAVQRIQETAVTNNGARAQETLNLKSRLDNFNGASLEQTFNAYANKVDGVGAQYVLKVQTEQDGTKTVAGMGIGIENGVSAIVFNADALQIRVPGAGPLPVFRADATGIYAPNLTVEKLKANSIDSASLKQAASSKTSYSMLEQDVTCSRNVNTTVITYNFFKEDSDSLLKITMFAQCYNQDDLDFFGDIVLDGVSRQRAQVRLIFDGQSSRGQAPITPFAFLANIPAGEHSIAFTLTSNETEGPTYVRAGSTLEVTELRRASIGSSTGAAAPVGGGGTGGGGTGGGGDYGGGGGGGYNPNVNIA